MNLGWILLSIAVIKARTSVTTAGYCENTRVVNPDPSTCMTAKRECRYEACYFGGWPPCDGDWKQGYGDRCAWMTSQYKWCYIDKCTTCKKEHYLDNIKCKACTEIKNCKEGSVSCSTSSNSVCNTCDEGYHYSTTTKKCERCPQIDNCAASITDCEGGESTCQKCNNGFYGSGTSSCIPCEGIGKCNSVLCSNGSDGSCEGGKCDVGYTGKQCDIIVSNDMMMLLDHEEDTWQNHKNTLKLNEDAPLINILSTDEFNNAGQFFSGKCDEVWIDASRKTDCSESDKRKCYALWDGSNDLWLNEEPSKDYLLITKNTPPSVGYKIKDEGDDYKACALYGKCKRYQGNTDIPSKKNLFLVDGLEFEVDQTDGESICNSLAYLNLGFNKNGAFKLGFDWNMEGDKTISQNCEYNSGEEIDEIELEFNICGYTFNFTSTGTSEIKKQGCLSCNDLEQVCSINDATDDIITNKTNGCFEKSFRQEFTVGVGAYPSLFDEIEPEKLWDKFPWIKVGASATGYIIPTGSYEMFEKGGIKTHDEKKSFTCKEDIGGSVISQECDTEKWSQYDFGFNIGAALEGSVNLFNLVGLSGGVSISAGIRVGLGAKEKNPCAVFELDGGISFSVSGFVRIFWFKVSGTIVSAECTAVVGFDCGANENLNKWPECEIAWFQDRLNRSRKLSNPLEIKTTNAWIPVAGRGKYKMNTMPKKRFSLVWSNSTNQILRRICDDCVEPYIDIYYRRFDTDGLPEDMDLLSIMTVDWKSDIIHNEMKNDFKIYSSYEDAKNDENEWAFCTSDKDGSKSVGFPSNCGFTELNSRDDQWSVITDPTNLAMGAPLYFNDTSSDRDELQLINNALKDIGANSSSKIRSGFTVGVNLKENAIISRVAIYSATFNSDFDLYVLDEEDKILQQYAYSSETVWPLIHHIPPVLAKKVLIEAKNELNITELEVFGTLERYSNPNLDGGKNDVVFYVEKGESTCALFDIDNIGTLSSTLTEVDLSGCDITEDDIVPDEENELNIFSLTDTNWKQVNDHVNEKFDLDNFLEVKEDVVDNIEVEDTNESQSHYQNNVIVQLRISLMIIFLISFI